MKGGARGRKALCIGAEALLLALVAVLFLRAVDAGDLARSAARITPRVLAGVIGFQAAILALGTLCWALILRQAGLYRGPWRSFWARTAGFAVTYLTPSASFGGVPARAELYREAGMDAGRLYATIALDTCLEVAGKIPCIAVGLVFLSFSLPSRPALIVVPVGVLALSAGLASIVLAGLLSGKGFRGGFLKVLLRPLAAMKPRLAAGALAKVRAFSAGLREVARDRRTVFLAAAAAVAIGAVEVAQTLFLLSALGMASVPRSLAIYSSILVQGITGALPGNLGGMEGAHMAVFTLLGLGSPAGLVYTAMLRAGQSSVVLAGILYIPFRRLVQARAVRQSAPARRLPPGPVASPGAL